VAFDGEARRRQAGQVAGAGVHVEHALAGVAAEVVVMVAARGLVAGDLARQVHHLDRAFVDQRLQVAVDRRQSQRRDFAARGVQDFGRRQRPAGGVDRPADGGVLAGGAFHGGRRGRGDGTRGLWHVGMILRMHYH
jgi:hypothetical protein